MSTVCPSPRSDSAPAGTSATRFSFVLISLGTPTIIPAPSGLVFRPQPHRCLPRRRKELRRHRRHVFLRQRLHSGDHLVEAQVLLAVERETRQTIHPRGRALQRQHQLPFGLPFGLRQRLAAQPLPRQPSVFPENCLRRLLRGRGLGADVGAQHADLPVEARVRVHGVGEPQLLTDALEQAARHPAAKDVAQHHERVFAPVGERHGVGRDHNVGLRGVARVTAGFPPHRCRDRRERRGGPPPPPPPPLPLHPPPPSPPPPPTPPPPNSPPPPGPTPPRRAPPP